MTATVRRTDGLLALVPSFFGFVPSESLVVVLIASGRVGVTAPRGIVKSCGWVD